MKKIIKDVKAGAMPIIAILIVVILVGAILVFYDSSDATDQWESESEFGSWGQDVFFEFEDGSTASVKSMMANEIMAVYYQGKKITSWKYELNAKGTGVGYESAKVDRQDCRVLAQLIQGGTVKRQHSIVMGGTKTFALDNKFHNIYNYEKDITTPITDNTAVGLYDFKISCTGILRYKGTPGGFYEDADLPTHFNFRVEVKRDAQNELNVLFAGRAELN